MSSLSLPINPILSNNTTSSKKNINRVSQSQSLKKLPILPSVLILRQIFYTTLAAFVVSSEEYN